jgi:preprotein translocase subunit SecF
MKKFFENAKYDFIGARRRAYTFSIMWCAVGLVMALFWQFRSGSWLRYGVDFAGGALIQIEFAQPTPIGDVRSLLESQFSGTEIYDVRGTNEFMIRAPQAAETQSSVEAVTAALRARFGDNSFTVLSAEFVGPKVGGELRWRAILAILVSFAATLIYLAIRFEWRFGMAAIVATVHDIALTLALVTAAQLEVELTMVAAFLTIVGYSLNDKIVVFDRVRENLKHAGRQESFTGLLNRSINETLPRTVLTGGATIGTLASLFFFGGSTIREFSFIMILGILLGTYSSIWIGAPVLLAIEQRWPGERKKARVTRQTPAKATVPT